jgi:tetratricopeptide (TPR) repeat protein
VSWSLLAQAELGAGRPRACLTAARRAIALDPAAAWPHRLASAARHRLGDGIGAVASALEAARLEPHNWLSHLSVAQAAIGAPGYRGPVGGVGPASGTESAGGVGPAGRPGPVGGADPDGPPGQVSEAAVALAQRAVATARELAPDEAEVDYAAGQVSRAAGDQDAAIAHFRRTLADNPAHGGALNELGRIWLDRGQTGQAAEHFIRAVRTAPGEAAYGRNVSVAVARMEASGRRLVAWVIYLSWVLMLLALAGGQATVNWTVTLTALVAAAATVTGVVLVQLRRLPREARVLFQGGDLALALGVCLCSLAVGVPAAQIAIARWPAAVLPVVAVMIAARLAAFRILRRGAARRRAQLPGSAA